MKIPDVQLFVQALVYLAIFLTGFVVSIPLGLSNINFNGDCLLYADIKWTSDTEFTFTPSTASNCQFPIYYNVFACIFYGLAMFIYFGYAILRQGPDVGSQMWVMPFLLLSAGITVVSFISSCIISVGFKSLCDGLTEKSDSWCHGSDSCVGFYKLVWELSDLYAIVEKGRGLKLFKMHQHQTQGELLMKIQRHRLLYT